MATENEIRKRIDGLENSVLILHGEISMATDGETESSLWAQIRKMEDEIAQLQTKLPPTQPENDDQSKIEPIAKFVLPSRKILTPASIEIVNVNKELLKFFHDHPEKIPDLGPGKFEDLIDAIFRNQGFDVERLGGVHNPDGGVDLIAVSKSIKFGEIRLAIQCKTIQRRSKIQTISAKPIRELAGVLDKFRVHKGILTTTGMFTQQAWSESEQHFSRISLEDRNALIERIRNLFPTQYY